MQVIDFNQPYKINNFNIKNIKKLSTFAGNGYYSKKAQHQLEKKYQFNKVLLTNSCTSALEIAALSLKLKKNDEVIVPSYSYPTTASAFLRCGYKIRFVDCNKDNPRINKKHFLSLINKKTKAVVIVQHAGQPEDITFFLPQNKNINLKLLKMLHNVSI